MGTAIGELVEPKKVEWSTLSSKRLGFDSYNIIYQFLSSIRGADGTPLMDSKGNVTSHLTGLFYRTANLLEKGIKPVFVFDGAHSELKSKTIEKRKEIRTRAIEAHEKALKDGDVRKAKELGSRALKVTPEMVKDAKKLLRLMGLPVIEAPQEGESQIAFMVQNGELDGCVSQDWDSLLFGAPVLYRNLTVSGKKKIPSRNVYVNVFPEKIVLKELLSDLTITREKLVWIGILIGNDFNEKFPKIGPKTALKLVKEHNDFESIINETGFIPDFDYKEIEELFMNPVHSSDYEISFGVPDKTALASFLCDEHDFSAERVKNGIERIEAKLREKGEQSSLSNWF
jgi:flap endonuclease-1